MGAPLPSAAGCVRIQYKGLTQGHPWVNTVFLNSQGPGYLVGDLNALALAAGNAWGSALAACASAATTCNLVEALDISKPDGLLGSSNAQHTGLIVATNPLPVSAAICFSEKVALRWRGGHPRFYLPAPTISEIQNGSTFTSAFVLTANTAADNYLTAMNAISIGGSAHHMVAVRYYSQKAVLASPKVLPIMDITVHTRLDSQRRRLGREVA